MLSYTKCEDHCTQYLHSGVLMGSLNGCAMDS